MALSGFQFGQDMPRGWRLTLGAGTAFRAPDSTQRFGFGGNPLLAPERAVKMDQVAAAILGTVDGERSFEQVVDKLAADFKAPREQIARDAGNFLTDLINKRMVEVRP